MVRGAVANCKPGSHPRAFECGIEYAERMPMATPELQRQYQREWLARRRAEWFAGKRCVHCGSDTHLEIDHIDPATKDPYLRRVHTNSFWSWSKERRDVELAKCQVLCHPCHIAKTLANGEHVRGEQVGTSKLTDKDVREIRVLVTAGATKRGTARQFGVDEKLIRLVVKGDIWKHVEGVRLVEEPPC